MSTSTLVVHGPNGGVKRTRDELATLATPSRTETWTPIPHWELVGHLHDGLANAGIQVAAEQYATSGIGDAKLFGVMDLVIPDLDTPDYRMAIGIRGSNDKSMAIQAVAGVRVFVCSNMAFSGDSGTVVLRKKHSSRLDLGKVVPPAIELYLAKAGAFKLDIERMQNAELTNERAKALIFDAFLGGRRVMPRASLPAVADLYFKDEAQRAMFPDRTLWTLNQSFTEAVKRLKPAPAEQASIQTGRYFGKVLRQLGIATSPRITDFDPSDVELPSDN